MCPYIRTSNLIFGQSRGGGFNKVYPSIEADTNA